MAQPKQGKKYLCKKTITIEVHLSGVEIYNKGDGYIKGKVYPSELDSCITDEFGDAAHFWDDVEDEPGSHTFSNTFEEVKENE